MKHPLLDFDRVDDIPYDGPSEYDSVTEEQWREYEQAGMLDPIDVRCGQNETDSGDTSTTEASV